MARFLAPALALSLVLLSACPDPRGDAPSARHVERGGSQSTGETSEAPRGNDDEGETAAAPAQPAPAAPPTAPAEPAAELLSPPAADSEAPAEFAVELQTSEGPVIIDVHRAWSPHGADRFYTLVRLGYFTDIAFFRVIEGFMAQAGIHGDPRVNAVWRDRHIPDDPVTQSNRRGMVSFATSGPNSRVNQFFINFGNNANLDPMGFSPFGRVRDMAIVDRIYDGYGEGAPSGRGPMQARIQMQGNQYLRAEFGDLDYIVSARILE